MKILKYLMENYNLDDINDIKALWEGLDIIATRDECTEFANILVLMENLPKNLCQKFWDRI